MAQPGLLPNDSGGPRGSQVPAGPSLGEVVGRIIDDVEAVDNRVIAVIQENAADFAARSLRDKIVVFVTRVPDIPVVTGVVVDQVQVEYRVIDRYLDDAGNDVIALVVSAAGSGGGGGPGSGDVVVFVAVPAGGTGPALIRGDGFQWRDP